MIYSQEDVTPPKGGDFVCPGRYLNIGLRGASFLSPMVLTPAAEWPAGSLSTNYEVMASISRTFPSEAAALGIYLGDSISKESADFVSSLGFGKARKGGYDPKNQTMYGSRKVRNPVTRAWQSIATYYTLQRSASELGTPYQHDELINTLTGNQVRNWEKDPSKPGGEIIDLLKKDNLSKQEWILLSDKLSQMGVSPNKHIYFSAISKYLPSLSSIRGIASFDLENVDTTSATYIWRNAFYKIIAGHTGLTLNESARSATRVENYFGKVLKDKSKVLKRIMGGEVAGQITDCYRYMPFLKSNEIYIPDQELQRTAFELATSYGAGTSPEAIKSIVDYFETGNAKAIVYHYPQESRLESVYGVGIVTQKQLAERGIKVTTSDRQGFAFGLGMDLGSNWSIGDFDFDIANMIPLLGMSKGKGKKWNIFDLASPHFNKIVEEMGIKKGDPIHNDIQKKLIPQKDLREEISALGKQLEDIFKAGITNGHYDQSLAVQALMNRSLKNMGWQPYDVFMKAAERESDSKIGTGSAYNLVRKLEAAAYVANWLEERIAPLISSRAQIYQPYLKRLAKGYSPLIDMFQTGTLLNVKGPIPIATFKWGEEDTDWHPGQALWGYSIWEHGKQVTESQLGYLLKSMIMIASLVTPRKEKTSFSIRFTTPETLLAFFAPSNNNPSDVLKELETISVKYDDIDEQADQQRKYLQALVDAAPTKNILNTPAMIAFMGGAIKTTEKRGEAIPSGSGLPPGMARLFESGRTWNTAYSLLRLQEIPALRTLREMSRIGTKSALGAMIRGTINFMGLSGAQSQALKAGVTPIEALKNSSFGFWASNIKAV